MAKSIKDIREYIRLNVGQNLNWLHIRRILEDIFDLLAIATNTYTAGKNIEITDEGYINLVADEYTEDELEAGYIEGILESHPND